MEELNVSDVPRSITTEDGTGRDEFKHYIWLLRKRFQCVVTKPVRVYQLESVEALVKKCKESEVSVGPIH